MFVGETDLQWNGVVGGCVVGERVAGLPRVGRFDQWVAGLNVGGVVGGGGFGVLGLVELELAEAKGWGEAALVAGGDEVAEAEAAADGGAAGGAFFGGGVTGDIDLAGDVGGEAASGEGA